MSWDVYSVLEKYRMYKYDSILFISVFLLLYEEKHHSKYLNRGLDNENKKL